MTTIALFDVDGTLTPARKEATAEMIEFLKTLKGKVRFSRRCGSIAPPHGRGPQARTAWAAAQRPLRIAG